MVSYSSAHSSARVSSGLGTTRDDNIINAIHGAELLLSKVVAPRYSDLVIAPCNEQACSAVREVIQAGRNRLLIVGGSGTGKTYLLQVLRSELALSGKVRLFRAEEWMLNRRKIERLDALLIDDLQILASSHGAIDLLAGAMRQVQAAGGKIVLGSTKTPSLRTAAMLGTQDWPIAHLHSPSRQDRMLLLDQMARHERLELPEGTVQIVAERVSGALRGMRGALNRLLLLRDQFGDAKLTTAQVVGALSPLEAKAGHTDLLEAVRTVVGRYHCLDSRDGRELCAYLLCRRSGITEAMAADWIRIGRSTVHYSVRRVEARAQEDSTIDAFLTHISVELDRELTGQAVVPVTGFAAISGGNELTRS